jgi:hypothetical protein
MFRFILGVITGGLVMWYRNRISEFEFAGNEIVGTREAGFMKPPRSSSSSAPAWTIDY